jgi:DNA-binding MarR family transcriptional regulator
MVQATAVRSSEANRALAGALFAVVQGSRHAVQDPVDRVTATMLADVGRLGPIRPSDLADQLRLDLSTVSRHVTTLVDKGLLLRSVHPDDARAQQLTLTDAGRRTLAEILDNRAATLGRATKHWSSTDRSQLSTLLERLADDLKVENHR